MAADDPRPGHNDWRPVPDPTTLTTDQLRRELSALREIITARLDGYDTATALLSETVNRTPTQIQTEIAHVRELIQEKLGSLGGRAEEKFASIEKQFEERDVRTNQAATAAGEALKAALQAAKEAVFEQAQAAAKAADKTELSTTKQIDLIQNQIKTLGESFTDKIDDLKGRIDRGEGSTSGSAHTRTEQRLSTGQVMYAASIVVSALLLAVALYAALHN